MRAHHYHVFLGSSIYLSHSRIPLFFLSISLVTHFDSNQSIFNSKRYEQIKIERKKESEKKTSLISCSM